MIFLSIIYHWMYLYSLPWAVPLLSYVVGGVWTILMVTHKREALASLTQQQVNSHVMIVLAYLAVFISHYAMQSMAMNKFVTEVIISQTLVVSVCEKVSVWVCRAACMRDCISSPSLLRYYFEVAYYSSCIWF